MSALPELGDDELAALALSGDERAFTQIMRRHKEPLYCFIRRYVGDSDEAWDLLQESFAAAWLSLAGYDRKRSFSVWLRRIGLNKCRDWSRRRAVRRWLGFSDPLDGPVGLSLKDPGLNPEEDLAGREALRRLDSAVAALPRGLKEPLILTAMDGLSQDEAGQLLGISRKAVEVRVYRARRALAGTLGIAPDAES